MLIKAVLKYYEVQKGTLLQRGSILKSVKWVRIKFLQEEDCMIVNWMFQNADKWLHFTKSQLKDSIQLYLHQHQLARMIQILSRTRPFVTNEYLR